MMFIVESKVIDIHTTKHCIALANLWWSFIINYIKNQTSFDVIMIIKHAHYVYFFEEYMDIPPPGLIFLKSKSGS